MKTATATPAMLPTEISVSAIRDALCDEGVPVFARRTLNGQSFTLYADDRYPQVFVLPDNDDMYETGAARSYVEKALADLRSIRPDKTFFHCGPLTDAERDLIRMLNQARAPRCRNCAAPTSPSKRGDFICSECYTHTPAVTA